MKTRRIFPITMAIILAAAMASCGSATNDTTNSSEKTFSETSTRVFTGFFNARKKDAVTEDNAVKKLIAEKIGAQCDETWLGDAENDEQIVNEMLLSGNYPDFIASSSGSYQKLLEANALVPIDQYWDEYPNIKNMYTESEWNRVRAEDGHIYIVPLFSKNYIRDTGTDHGEEAFWVQVKVLEWAGYPEIVTLEDYFDLLESYIEANPTNEKGEPYIGYEILANDTYFFSLDNPPMFLDGYPNDGCCYVNEDTLEACDYNRSPTAERWFSKLNEEYAKGLIDPECFVLSTDQYYEKIKSGRVLGMVDQHWNFNNATLDLPPECTYIPIGVTIDQGIKEHYHSQITMNNSSGVSVTVSCTDPDGAFKFMSDLLEPEILTLRFWGIEGKDYMVGDDGIFYQTDEQRQNWHDAEYARANICLYNNLPYYFGMAQDGINAYCPSYQPNEFYEKLSDDVKRCFDAYGVKTYVELLNEAPENKPWYPMWTYNNTLTDSTPEGRVMKQLDALKHKYLPQLVMTNDFQKLWAEYSSEYDKIDSQIYFDALTAEVRRRCEY